MKILQVLGHDEIKFSLPLFKMFHRQDEFASYEVTFLTTHRIVYDSLIKENDNLIITSLPISKYLNKHGSDYDLIIIHSYDDSIKNIASLKENIAKRIVWRTWGHDVINLYESKKFRIPLTNKYINNPFSKLIDKYYFNKAVRNIDMFYALGCSNKEDAVSIYNSLKLSKMPKWFTFGYQYEIGYAERLKTIYEGMQKNESLNIMVGHSGFPDDNHLDTLKRLSRFKEDNIKIVLVLSYGKDKYIEEVKKCALEIFKSDKVVIIDKMMNINEYNKFLSTMDIFMIDCDRSNALGNVDTMLYLGKKVFVKENMFIDSYLTNLNLEHYLTKDLDDMTFEELSSSAKDKEKLHNAYIFFEDDYYDVKEYIKLFETYGEEILNGQK